MDKVTEQQASELSPDGQWKWNGQDWVPVVADGDGAGTQKKKSNGFAITALVLSILAVLVAMLPVLGMLAFLFAFVALGFVVGGFIVASKRGKGLAVTVTALVLALGSMALAVTVTSASVVYAVDDAFDATDEFSAKIGAVSTDAYRSTAPITITNTTDKVQSYWITVVAESPNGAKQYDSSSVIASDIRAGQTVEKELSFSKVPADAKLSVTDAW